jgi:hypothetical protein
MTTTTLQKLALASSYDYHNKEHFRKKALAFLRKVAKLLNLSKDEYQVRFNAGGIAVCGDPILHTKRFYVDMHPLFGSSNECGYWRECEGMTDYTGKYNRQISLGLTAEDFANEIKKVLTKE